MTKEEKKIYVYTVDVIGKLYHKLRVKPNYEIRTTTLPLTNQTARQLLDTTDQDVKAAFAMVEPRITILRNHLVVEVVPEPLHVDVFSDNGYKLLSATLGGVKKAIVTGEELVVWLQKYWVSEKYQTFKMAPSENSLMFRIFYEHAKPKRDNYFRQGILYIVVTPFPPQRLRTPSTPLQSSSLSSPVAILTSSSAAAAAAASTFSQQKVDVVGVDSQLLLSEGDYEYGTLEGEEEEVETKKKPKAPSSSHRSLTKRQKRIGGGIAVTAVGATAAITAANVWWRRHGKKQTKRVALELEGLEQDVYNLAQTIDKATNMPPPSRSDYLTSLPAAPNITKTQKQKNKKRRQLLAVLTSLGEDLEHLGAEFADMLLSKQKEAERVNQKQPKKPEEEEKEEEKEKLRTKKRQLLETDSENDDTNSGSSSSE